MGRDVESMVRDLVEISVKMESDLNKVSIHTQAEQMAEEKILDSLLYKEERIMKRGKNLEKCLEKEN